MENPKEIPTFSQSKIFMTMCEIFDDEPSYLDIDKLLSISEAELNEYGKHNSKLKEMNPEIVKYLQKATWGIRTYLTFQDVFEYSFDFDANNLQKYFQGRYYCYHESLVYLRQLILSIINGNSLAAITLIRPFIELSLFNLYWFKKTENDKTPKSNDWLNSKI
jgi:hypothetical protein